MITIIKNTDCSVKFKCFDGYMSKVPIDLTAIYLDYICAVTDKGRLLIEKKFSTNDIDIITEQEDINPYIIKVKFKKQDTLNLKPNPSNEEVIRTIEVFGITKDREVKRLFKTDFYLEGSGYYVR